MTHFYIDPATSTRHYPGIPFTYGDMNYTTAGATAETFASLGFKEVAIQPRPDDRYYIVNSNPKDDGSWDAQPRDLDELKTAAIRQVKTTAGSLLSQSDWMIIRQGETGDDTPQDVLDRRAEIRDRSNRKEAAIAKAESLAALAAYLDGSEHSDWGVSA